MEENLTKAIFSVIIVKSMDIMQVNVDKVRKKIKKVIKTCKTRRKNMLLMVTTKDEEILKDQWYLDSGCSSHMIVRKS